MIILSQRNLENLDGGVEIVVNGKRTWQNPKGTLSYYTYDHYFIPYLMFYCSILLTLNNIDTIK